MPSFTSFTRPPHYQLNDVETAEYLEVQSNKTSPLVWVAGWAVAACVALGVWTSSQPAVNLQATNVQSAAATKVTAQVPRAIGMIDLLKIFLQFFSSSFFS